MNNERNILNSVYIETEKLIVRTFDENDFEQFKKLLDMPEYMGWQMQKPRAKEFFNWQISNYEKMDIVNGSICLGIFDRLTGEIIGQVAAQEHDDLHEPEFGYGILPFTRGKGYAKEAAKAVLKWIEMNYNFPYIIGTTGVDNIASQKILEYLGFSLVDERNLLVHIANERYDFRYYRYYLNNSLWGVNNG
jgi:RimJ/RimL family protein N-acetyltransferase